MTQQILSPAALGAMVLAGVSLLGGPAYADSLTCNLAGYKEASGLTAAADGRTLTLTWAGPQNDELGSLSFK